MKSREVEDASSLSRDQGDTKSLKPHLGSLYGSALGSACIMVVGFVFGGGFQIVESLILWSVLGILFLLLSSLDM